MVEEAETFRSNQALQQYVLTGVGATDKILGRGSYGIVMEVIYEGLVYAAKKMHDVLLQQDEGVETMSAKYYKECELMSSLHHPNITRFMGICFLPNEQLPLLVMEKLEMNLDYLLETTTNLLLPLKLSILEDVCCGLNYLHTRNPNVIHRDLTAKNVLLNSSLTAKISDMGNSRIVAMAPDELARTLTQLPGTLVYMPPEAMGDSHRYGPSLDIFSFGHLALFTLIQEFPGNLLESTYPDTCNRGHVIGRTELERREVYIDQLRTLIRSHPSLIDLVVECLQNEAENRPTSEDLLGRIHTLKEEADVQHGGRAARFFDVWRVSLTQETKEIDIKEKKKLKEENKRLKRELEESKLKFQKEVREKEEKFQKEKHKMELESTEMQSVLQCRISKLQAENEELSENHEYLLQKNSAALDGLSQANIKINEQQKDLHHILHKLRQKTVGLECELQHRGDKLRSMTEKLECSVAAVEKLFTQLRTKYEHNWIKHKAIEKSQSQSGSSKVLRLPFSISWQRGIPMPHKMSRYLQSVVIGDIIYIGGGNTTGGNSTFIVTTYNMASQKWQKLQPYTTSDFALAVINNQLILVGGVDKKNCASSNVGVWESSAKKWTRLYKPMPTARSHASAIGYRHWLVVAGGKSDRRISNVEILDTVNNQWANTTPAPELWTCMKSALVGDIWYLMGGFDSNGTATDKVYKVSVHDLMFHSGSLHPAGSLPRIWSTVSQLGCHSSAPVGVANTLLAVGGISNKTMTVESTIQCFNPETNSWTLAGELMSPISQCTCAVSSIGQLIVAGGGQDLMLYIGSL